MDLAGSGVDSAMVTKGAVARDVENDVEIEMQLDVEAAPATPTTFTELYARELQPLVRLATLMTGRAEAARDIVQDAFVKLHVRRPVVREPAAYVRRSVVNGCRSRCDRCM